MRRIIPICLLTAAAYLAIPSTAYSHDKLDCNIFKHPKSQVLSLEGHTDLLYKRMNRAFRNVKVSKTGYSLVTANSRRMNFSFGPFNGSYNEKNYTAKETSQTLIEANAEIHFSDSYLEIDWTYAPSTRDFMVKRVTLGVDVQCPPIWKETSEKDEDDKTVHREYEPRVTPELRVLVQKLIRKAEETLGSYTYQK